MQSGCMNSWLCRYLTGAKNVLDVHPASLIGTMKVITAHIVEPTCEVNKMSYRLIDSNAIAIKYPEVNEMPCVFADLPDGLHGQFIGTQSERKNGKWICHDEREGYLIAKYSCSVCDYYSGTKRTNFCPNCGADMRGEMKITND